MDKQNNTDKSLTGLNADNMIVSKSYPIYDIQQKANLDLFELKILDLYLGRINPFDPDSYTVIFTKKELENALGVDRIKGFTQKDFNKRLNNLFKGIILQRTDDDGIIHDYTVSLLDHVDVYKDKKGRLQLSMACGFAAREYIFNIKGIKYFKYHVRPILKLKSIYSYRLYTYLSKESEIRALQEPISWQIAIEDLKQILCNDNKGQYNDNYYEFNRNILEKAHKEITENTNLQFTYKPVIDVSEKRRYSHVNFKVTSFDEVDSIRAKRLSKRSDDTKDEKKELPDKTDNTDDPSNVTSDTLSKNQNTPDNNTVEPNIQTSDTNTTTQPSITSPYLRSIREAEAQIEKEFVIYLKKYCKENDCRADFTEEQIRRLIETIRRIPKNFEEIGCRKDPDEELHYRRYLLGVCEYFKYRYKDMYMASKNGNISSHYGYFKTMLEQDIDSPKTV